MSKTFEIIAKEQERQNNTIELIASENFVSENIMRAVGSIMTNKYTEGYPAKRKNDVGRAGRYYGGCENFDELEEYCCEIWRKVFNTDYHVNVQPHSGSQANMAAYMSVLNIGDTILAMSLDAGGHLTHGSPVSFVSKLYNVIPYGVNDEGLIDYEDLEKKIGCYKPKLILAGASAYSRTIDFERIYDIIQKAKFNSKYYTSQQRIFNCVDGCSNPDVPEEYNPIFMVDMAHIAGLVATGHHPSPFGYADIITTTTHKTLRGPRGGLIFCKPELANAVDSAVFPRCQGGAIQNIIAGKAICAEEAMTADYCTYIDKVVRNCKAMAQEFIDLGYKIVSGGTDNHLFLLDLTGHNVTGLELQEACDANGITLNKNAIPNDPRGPRLASGVRIGTAPMTTKGYTADDFKKVAHKIHEIILNIEKEKEV